MDNIGLMYKPVFMKAIFDLYLNSFKNKNPLDNEKII
jgi:hypothetical protein